MAKKTQAEKAQAYLAKHPKLAEVFGTSDGFNFEKVQDALGHSTTLEKKGIEVFKRDGKTETLDTSKDETPQSKFLKQNVKQINEALPSITDVKALEGYLAAEKTVTVPRATAITAIEARIAELANK